MAGWGGGGVGEWGMKDGGIVCPEWGGAANVRPSGDSGCIEVHVYLTLVGYGCIEVHVYLSLVGYGEMQSVPMR